MHKFRDLVWEQSFEGNHHSTSASTACFEILDLVKKACEKLIITHLYSVHIFFEAKQLSRNMKDDTHGLNRTQRQPADGYLYHLNEPWSHKLSANGEFHIQVPSCCAETGQDRAKMQKLLIIAHNLCGIIVQMGALIMVITVCRWIINLTK